ncbi:MAG: SAM-dependent methyltransferase, partial [Simkania negevensis]|nr:SAM-dependent methyltransferase [Simkania negevensis]
MKFPGLFLLPNLLYSELEHHDFLPPRTDKLVSHLDGLIAESPKGGRAFLKRFTFPEGRSFREVPIAILNEHTTKEEKKALVEPLKRGESWGMISDCGLPSLADPGADLVFEVRKLGIPIEVILGPSSLILALLHSGLGGERFAFHGYLPREIEPLKEKLLALEKRSLKEGETELFIEAPYRTEKLFYILLETLSPETFLSLSLDLSLPTQMVSTKKIKEWRKE